MITKKSTLEADRLQQLERQVTDLKRQLAARDELAATLPGPILIHELSQPLTAIVLFSHAGLRLLDADRFEPREWRHILEQIVAQSEHAERLIQHVRTRWKSGSSVRIPVQINAQIQEALRLCADRLQTEKVCLELDLADSLPDVQGDPIQLEQVLLNLFHNAVDAMCQSPPGRRGLLVRSLSEGEEVQVMIRDTGVGLRPDRPHPPSQPHPSTKPRGMGLGLALCRSILREHGGRLRLEANQGPGASAFLSLPLAPRN